MTRAFLAFVPIATFCGFAVGYEIGQVWAFLGGMLFNPYLVWLLLGVLDD